MQESKTEPKIESKIELKTVVGNFAVSKNGKVN